MLTIIDLFRLLNVVLALSAVPPSIFLFKMLLNERQGLLNGERNMNSILILLFVAFVVASISNAILSTLTFFDYLNDPSFLGNFIFNSRNTIVNVGYSAIAWGFWYIVHRYKKK